MKTNKDVPAQLKNTQLLEEMQVRRMLLKSVTRVRNDDGDHI